MPRYVDAEKLILTNYEIVVLCNGDCKKALKMMLDKIENAPTVDAEPVRHGRWVDEMGMILCSECRDSWGTEMEEMVRDFNYCPNCGAKMDEVYDERV